MKNWNTKKKGGEKYPKRKKKQQQQHNQEGRLSKGVLDLGIQRNCKNLKIRRSLPKY